MNEISISNIAWDPLEDDFISKILLAEGITSIDVAPGKYFKDVKAASTRQIKELKATWADRGFHFVGMQSLFFGTSGFNLFGEKKVQEQMLEYLKHICRIGAELDAKKLVFGSPKNRDRTGLSDDVAYGKAYDFFKKLGKIAKQEGVIVCLEANPTCYGCNFLTTTKSVFDFVSALSLSSIKMQLDTGTMLINQESEALIPYVLEAVGHIHISEPQLCAIKEDKHQAFGRALHSCSLARTIEMLTRDTKDPLIEIRNSILKAKKYYG